MRSPVSPARRAAAAVLATLLAAGAALGIGAGEPGEQDAGRAAAERIDELAGELHGVLAARARAEAGHARRVEALDRDLDRLRTEAARLEESVQAAEREVSSLEDRAAAGEAEARRLAGEIAEAAAALRPHVEALLPRIEAGVPHRRAERARRVTHCLAGLAADEPADRAEAVAELLAAAADELELAGRVELREGELVLEDGARRLPARVLRLGLALALGASEDGEVLAVAHPGTGGEWRTGLDPGTRDAVRRALEAARGRRPPGLVPLPFAADPARPSTVPRAGNGRGAAPPGGSRAPGDDP